jgi:hypothetical protein
MKTRATSSWRFLAPIGGLLIVAVVAVIACGGSSTSPGNTAATPTVAHSEAAAPRQITITLQPSALSTLNDNAPADKFAFYVAESSAPAEVGDLPQYRLYICSTIGANIPGIQTVLGITSVTLSTMYGVPSGFDATSCIQDASTTAKTVVFAQRETPLPSGVALVELTFK